MYKKTEFNRETELKKQIYYDNLLSKLRPKRKLALAGTLSGIALICTNIQLVSDVNFALATTGTVILPYFTSYFSVIQDQINNAIIGKRRSETYIEDHYTYRLEETSKQYKK